MTSNFILTHQTCPICHHNGCFSVRADGSGYCHSCGKNYVPDSGGYGYHNEKVVEGPPMSSLQAVSESYRSISPKTFKKYNVKTIVNDKDEKIGLNFPRPDGSSLNRALDRKEFWFTGERGDGLPLFGSDIFPAGSAKAITITEGYLDALSVYEIMGDYPAVSVQSASSAKTECAKAFEYLDSFEKIYLAFDADEPGQKAADSVARLFDFNKVYLVKLDKELKDANGYLTGGKARDFEKGWWNSKRFLPEGILSSLAEFDSIIDDDGDKPAIPYPFEKLQELTYGMRTGELVLITAQEGIGKTEILRAFEYHLLKNTDENIGIIHLEESKARTLKGLVGYELKSPIHLPEFSISKEDIKKGLRSVTRRDERVHIYSHFGSDDPDVILSTVRFMAGACGCKRIFLDHITMVVSGLQGEDERRALDYISTRLAMMVEELDFTLFLVSHVNDEGQTRGSRNIGKVADLRLDLHRDLTAETDEIRNTTYVTCSKNRFSGKTGPAGRLLFDTETFMLNEVHDEIPF